MEQCKRHVYKKILNLFNLNEKILDKVQYSLACLGTTIIIGSPIFLYNNAFLVLASLAMLTNMQANVEWVIYKNSIGGSICI